MVIGAWNSRTREAGTLAPILRWAGGKRQLRPKLLEFVPATSSPCRYFEPFVGAGTLFFSRLPECATLADANHHLISTYTWIREAPADVSASLALITCDDSAEQYYRIRTLYNRNNPSAERAAQFIYLNRTCFNGIFRVNTRDEFNVPYGHLRRPWFPSAQELVSVADALRSVTLLAGSFEESTATAKAGDFVYLDPPYPPLTETSYFTHYTKDRFGFEDQRRVAAAFRDLDQRGCFVMLSNADTEQIRGLYRGFRWVSLPVNRWVTCRREKFVVNELIVTNYDPPAREISACATSS